MTDQNPLRDPSEGLESAPPASIVIFGASGDLTRRKLIPALYNLAKDGLLSPSTNIIGFARRDWGDAGFREAMKSAVTEFSRRQPVDEPVFAGLSKGMRYIQGDFDRPEGYPRLAEMLRAIETERNDPGVRLYYLATPPASYEPIVTRLAEHHLADRSQGAVRIVVEKPFGHDLASAMHLNGVLSGAFDESQIFRIDHYLGKETVQNLLVFRLDNGFFEPLLNRAHVSHVQITVAEAEGVGTRAGYYESAGVSRDMLQNHLLQLLSMVCMEPPVQFEAKSVRDEKVKVLRAIHPFSEWDALHHAVRGQYTAGMVEGNPAKGYLEEEGVSPSSGTETFLAVRLEVNTWRWAGVPFFLRSGKCLPKRASEIDIVFKRPPYELFRERGAPRPAPNVLRLRIQPEERISLSFEAKAPGQAFHIEEVRMDFSYSTSFGMESPEAYERLLLDALHGDSTLFAREDEVALSWKIVDSLIQAWTDSGTKPFPYAAGTWGPPEAEELPGREGRRWIAP
jgi:glucose-6-phosphate 1-dehydrogenase